MDVVAWAEAYRKAWEERDADAAAQLFTEDAEYRDQSFTEPRQGRAGVHEYWSTVTATQSDVSVRMGRPFVDGNRAVVEFWTNMKNDGQDVTLAGALLLEFAEDGSCRRLREYWFFSPSATPPHEGWGT
jgi:ketosteroid isomerase-like protein